MAKPSTDTRTFSYYNGSREEVHIPGRTSSPSWFLRVNVKCGLHYPLLEPKTRGTAGVNVKQKAGCVQLARGIYSFLPLTPRFSPCVSSHTFPVAVFSFHHPHILLPTATNPPGLVRVTSGSSSSSHHFIHSWAKTCIKTAAARNIYNDWACEIWAWDKKKEEKMLHLEFIFELAYIETIMYD